MVGPHHSIICRFTCGLHGAAPWSTSSSEAPLNAAFAASSARSRRTNWVGTRCTLVIACSSIRRRVSSGTKRSWTTTLEPPIIGKKENAHWAEW